MQTRVRRPYEKKLISKGGALIFGLGLGALLATAAIGVALAMPTLSPHLDNLVYRARTYYRKLIPHPEYLPTPVPTAVVTGLTPAAPIQAHPPESTPTSTATLSPTSTPIPITTSLTEQVITPSPSPIPNVALQSVGSSIQLSGINHQWQTWNNCGPATVTMNLSYFGRPELQADAAPFLKPNRDDKNVNPEELAAYARTTGMEALVRRGGSIEQLKLLLSNNLPVLAETWLVHDGDGLGHYRLVTGFDDTADQFNTFDSLNGPDFKVTYEQFDSDWRVFNRTYVLVYPSEQAETVAAIIGPDMDDTTLNERLTAEAQAETEANPNDAIAFFNQGDALTRLGRFQEAVAAFDRARQLGLHWRRLWYQFTPFEAYYAAGRYQDVLDLAEATLKGSGGLEEAYYYKGLALRALGQPGAEQEFQAALDYNPNFAAAAEAMQN
ncbi:MAG: C39 family peptidase [Anaerolineae bacterium]|nr:C39 family peptidase [Anaerolineae bacterium]